MYLMGKKSILLVRPFTVVFICLRNCSPLKQTESGKKTCIREKREQKRYSCWPGLHVLVQLRLPSFTAFHVCCDTRAHKSPFWGKGTVCPKKPNWSTQGTENNYSGYETNTNTKLHFRMQLHEPKEIQTASLREEQRAASISVDLCLV